jgi:uncharacterized surface protein with fasciclin (FAS1) repeats
VQLHYKHSGGKRMAKRKLEKMVAGLLVAMLLATSLPVLTPTSVSAASLAQQVRDRQVRGTIPGGQFAKFWLGLEPEESGATVSIVSEWDRPNPSNNGVGFFILDENGLRRVGDEALSSIALAAGDPNFVLNGPDNAVGASFNAIGLAPYTLVVYNDSASDANFTLTATNGFITDESNQVTGQAGTPATTTDEAETPAETTAPAAEPAPPTTAVTTTTTVTPTAETTATAATETTTPTVAAPVATAPVTTETVATVTATREVRATTMDGDLPNQDDQHFLGLVPSQRDGNISLSLTFDPQDNSELARRLNFWVLDDVGFTQFLRGTNPGEVAMAAGNRTFRGDTNERVASFNATGLGPYTVIVYNNSLVPGSYSITAEGGTLIDDSGQTRTAQAAGALGATGTVTVTGATTGTVTTLPAATTTTTPTTASTTATTTITGGRSGQPGGTYTVQSGDTLSLIARDIYGSVNVYQQICTLNGIANCNIIEVGDVLRLPTLEQVQSGVTAAAPATTAPAATTTTTQPAATTAAATTAVTTTVAVTTTPAVTPTTSITPTGAVTPTGTTTPTTTTATTTAATGAAGTSASGSTLVNALAADGRFTLLVQALQATGLDSVLEGRGPFTIFAPTDAAFAASLPEGAFEQLLNDPGGQLTDILRYHVVPGESMAEDLSNGMQATTVQGKTVRFEVQGNSVRVNGASVVTPDIDASNGVVHAIDAVILPPPD